MSGDKGDGRGDITGTADIRRLVDDFYGRALHDPEIGYFFTEVARIDLPAHLPRLYAFWESLLLGGTEYRGNPMQVHEALHRKSPLEPRHFARWLVLWEATVDSLFAGPKALEAKQRARSIADSMTLRTGGRPLFVIRAAPGSGAAGQAGPASGG